jgi:hypothetical protein
LAHLHLLLFDSSHSPYELLSSGKVAWTESEIRTANLMVKPSWRLRLLGYPDPEK